MPEKEKKEEQFFIGDFVENSVVDGYLVVVDKDEGGKPIFIDTKQDLDLLIALIWKKLCAIDRAINSILTGK